MIRNILIYEIIFLLVAYGAYDYIVRNLALFGDYSVVWKGIILGVIGAIVPPFCFKTTYELLGKTWAGTITNIKYEIRYPQPVGGARSQTTGRITSTAKLGNSQEFMKMKLVTDSDAHYLENMLEASEAIDIPELTAQAVVDYILGK
jgi:hypothetical protein